MKAVLTIVVTTAVDKLGKAVLTMVLSTNHSINNSEWYRGSYNTAFCVKPMNNGSMVLTSQLGCADKQKLSSENRGRTDNHLV